MCLKSLLSLRKYNITYWLFNREKFWRTKVEFRYLVIKSFLNQFLVMLHTPSSNVQSFLGSIYKFLWRKWELSIILYNSLKELLPSHWRDWVYKLGQAGERSWLSDVVTCWVTILNETDRKQRLMKYWTWTISCNVTEVNKPRTVFTVFDYMSQWITFYFLCPFNLSFYLLHLKESWWTQIEISKYRCYKSYALICIWAASFLSRQLSSCFSRMNSLWDLCTQWWLRILSNNTGQNVCV